ncbi:MAG: redox-sensing transcriptional repressor Rex [Acidobacteria bacterium]|nr:MAG: redox-sensing transcriptional repressor Rex [Acidobacteriota bacterium]
MKSGKVSEFATERVSLYYRCLEALEERGIETTSSMLLAEQFGLNSAQIRKDLAYFGQFLKSRLATILGRDAGHRVCVVGGGNLGMALTEYGGFARNGFALVAIFDCDARKIGQRSRSGVPVHDVRRLAEVVRDERITMAIIAVPAGAAQSVCDRLIEAGVRAILNFAPRRLSGRAGTKIKSIDLSISLESLAYFLSSHPDGPEAEDGKLDDIATSPTLE